MKHKIAMLFLGLMMVASCAFGVAGCELVGTGSSSNSDNSDSSTQNSHIHSFSDEWSYDAEYHWRDCSCGEKEAYSTHVWSVWNEVTPATETNKGLEERTCVVCGQKQQREIDRLQHVHNFVNEVADTKYIASEANCTSGALYYKSCSCGEVGTETFVYGEPVHHYVETVIEPTCEEQGYTLHKCNLCEVSYIDSYVDKLSHKLTYVSEKAPTCLVSGNDEYWTCTLCNKIFSDNNGKNQLEVIPVINATGHSYSSEWSKDATNHWHAATCEHTLEVADKAAHTYDSNNVCIVCGYKNNGVYGTSVVAKTLALEGNRLSLVVPNSTTYFSFINEFTVADGASWIISKNIEGTDAVASKTISLTEGDNICYLLVTNGLDTGVYTILIHRTAKYTITFNTDGGTAVESQIVEEGGFATMPTTSKMGYTFVKWDYDFNKPITDNITINAVWRANNDTAYKVEYYLENIEDDEYTLKESIVSYGTTDTIISATIKNYEHFSPTQSTVSGTINADGSTILKVYYARDRYTVTFVGNGGTLVSGKETQIVKYLGSVIAPVYTYTGYSFNGFDRDYTTITQDIVITAQWLINKTDYDMSKVVFANKSVTYDGSEQFIYATNLPIGVTVSYVNNGQTDAGTYTIIAKFSGDTENHNAIPDMTAQLIIKKATYDMSSVVFNDKEYTYNGEKRNIVITSLPAGVSVTYNVDGEEFNGATDAGVYEITASFKGDSKNYNAISNKIATLTINKAVINISRVIFNDEEIEFDGKLHSIVVKNLPAEINANDITYYYNNKQVDGVSEQGTYTVVATFNVSDNYFALPNIQATLIIKRTSYADKYAKYGVLGKSVDLINASKLETLSGASNVFKDDLYYIDIDRVDLGAQEGKAISSTSISEIMSDLSVSMDLKVAFGSRTNKNGGFLTNKLPSFNIEASGAYEKKKKSQTNAYYYTYNYVMDGYRVDILGYKDPSSFQALISDELIQDALKIRTGAMTPEQFVNRWGTHVIMSAIYGEKVEVSYSNISNNIEDTTQWKAALDAEFSQRFLKTGLNIDASLGVSSIESSVTSTSMQNFSINVTSQKQLSATSLDNFTNDYSAWLSGHTDGVDYSIFTDVPDGSLYCVWYLLGDEYADVIQIMDTYMLDNCSQLYQEKIAAINSLSLSDDVEFDSQTHTLSINLNYYQELGNLDLFEGQGLFDNGVFNITPYWNGNQIEHIVINGSYGARNANGQVISTIIDGCTLSFDKDWIGDIDITFNNVGVYTANEKGFIDVSAVSRPLNVTIDYNGTNVIYGHNGTESSVAHSALILEDDTLKIISSSSSASLEFRGGDGECNNGEGKDGAAAIIVGNMTINSAGAVSVYGGNGGDGLNGREGYTGGNGGNGGVAIQANSITVEAGTLLFTGGNGGNGGDGISSANNVQDAGNGGNGGTAVIVQSFTAKNGVAKFVAGNGGNGGQGPNQNDCPAKKPTNTWSNDRPETGSAGYNGANGGNGGDSGRCLVANTVSVLSQSSVCLIESVAGRGGDGGNGGKGGAGGDSDWWLGNVQGGDGGNGGNGGNGGDSGVTLNALVIGSDIKDNYSGVTIVMCTEKLQQSIGGAGGAGGDAGLNLRYEWYGKAGNAGANGIGGNVVIHEGLDGSRCI